MILFNFFIVEKFQHSLVFFFVKMIVQQTKQQPKNILKRDYVYYSVSFTLRDKHWKDEVKFEKNNNLIREKNFRYNSIR